MHKREEFFDLLSVHKYPKQVYVDLFRILSIENDNYTTNSNGIFFNLHGVDDPIIDKATIYLKGIYNNIENYNKTIKERQEQIESLQDNLPQRVKKPSETKKKTTDKNIPVVAKRNPFTDIEYKGVYKRLDNVLKGRINNPVSDKKQARDKTIEEEDSDEDLFGENEDIEEDIEAENDEDSDAVSESLL